MAMYVTTDGSGRPTAFYDSQHGAPPAGAQEITSAQYAALWAAPTTTTFIAGVLGTVSAPAAASPVPAVQAMAALAAGLAITSTAHASALNGTYALDDVTLGIASDLVGLINANSGAFPGSASTWSWPDLSGALHVFPSAAEFVAFQKALATYRLALYAVIWGVTSTLPADAATIA